MIFSRCLTILPLNQGLVPLALIEVFHIAGSDYGRYCRQENHGDKCGSVLAKEFGAETALALSELGGKAPIACILRRIVVASELTKPLIHTR